MEETSKSSMSTFTTYEGSTDQIADSSSVKKFTCSLCEFQFSQQKYLTNHFKHCKDVKDRMDADTITIKQELKTEDQMHSMEFFDEYTTTEPTLDVKVEEMEFTETSVSGSTNTAAGQFIVPPNAETPEEVFPQHMEVCSLCDYVCATRGSLTVHMRMHTREKPFKCTLCEYAGRSSSHLTRHMRTHTGEKPFKCTWCDFTSSYGSNLTSHMKTHTGEKPFKCYLCDYASARKTGLTEHMVVHTGEKPFKCSLCDYASSYRNLLKQHMRTHTGEKLICESIQQ